MEPAAVGSVQQNIVERRRRRPSLINFFVILFVSGIVIGDNVPPVTGEDEDAHKSTKEFDLWIRFPKGFDSVSVTEGERLSIRCRVNLNGTELKDTDDLSEVRMTYFKDNVTLPNYWTNKTAATVAKVIRHSKFAFDYEKADLSHRGLYKCEAVYKGQREEMEFLVRVKVAKLELPAMIIGVQIIILAIIFFIYERRQKKKETKFKAEGAQADAAAAMDRPK